MTTITLTSNHTDISAFKCPKAVKANLLEKVVSKKSKISDKNKKEHKMLTRNLHQNSKSF